MAADIVIYLTLSSAVKYLLHCRGVRKRPDNAKCVGFVKCIRLFPVKSMSCIEYEQAECTFDGLKAQGMRDRQWMVVTAQKNSFVTARAKPKLAVIKVRSQGDSAYLETEGMPPLELSKQCENMKNKIIKSEVWGEEVTGFDAGDEAASWIEKALDKPAGTYRLICHSTVLEPRILSKQPDEWHESCKPQDQANYQDGFPYLLISSNSVNSLAKKVAESGSDNYSLTMENFRPNIEVDGCEPYDEDSWNEIFIGEEVKFTNVKPCGRCVLTTVDPLKGIKREDGEPLKTLKKTRPFVDGSPSFGINLLLDWPGNIRVGQPVFASQKRQSSF